MKKILVASSLLLALSVNAHASVVSFEDTAVDAYQPTSFASGELTFTPIADYVYTYTNNPGSYNGSNALIAGWGAGVGSFSFSETDNSVFSLNSLDAGTTHGGGIGSVVFTGHQLGGGILTQTLALDFFYANYVFNWANLLSVDVSANSDYGYVAYDNINVSSATVNAVPVPAAVWLFGSALTGLYGMGKRKQPKVLTA
jgi:hypothetical protein